MADQQPRLVEATAAIVAVFALAYVIVGAAIWAELHEVRYAEAGYVTILVVLSGLIPAWIQMRCGVRTLLSFVAVGIASGAVAVYLFMFIFGQTFVLFGHPAPKPLFTILAGGFNMLGEFDPAAVDVTNLLGVLLVSLAGAVCPGLLWWFGVRKRHRAAA